MEGDGSLYFVCAAASPPPLPRCGPAQHPAAALCLSPVVSIPCLPPCFLGLQRVSVPSPPPWPRVPGCLSPPGTLGIGACPQHPGGCRPCPVPLPRRRLQPLHLLHPSRALVAARAGGAPPVLCDRTQAAQPSCQQGTGGGPSLPSPVHLPWAELALEVAQSSPITSGACLCSLGRRINYQGCGAVDHSSYYFLLLQIGVVESSVPFNPRSSVYFPAGSTNAAFPITSQRASDRSLRKTCCNCLFFSIFKHF